MSIKELEITDQNVQSTYVQSQPDRLTGTAQQNKAVFDALPQLIIQRFNLLLEALAGEGAAGEIPVWPIEGVTAETVQQALEAIQQNLTAYINKIKAATGAAEVGVSTISGIEADNVQAALQALRTIQSAIDQNVQTIMSKKGAEKVGVSAISGMTAQNVQQALVELRKAIDNIVSGIIPGGSITPDMLSEPIPIRKGGHGATTAPAALAALGAGVRPNELDNAYFVGGGTNWGVFPVNQRGVYGTISAPGSFIDRWKLVSGTVQITAAGLVLNGTIAQVLPAPIGSVCTATAVTTTGIVTCQYDDASRTFTINGTGQTFVFAKLEKGLGQTAAYQDEDGAWRQLTQPESDYATQLEKCQAYLLDITPDRKFNTSYIGLAIGEYALFTIPIPTTMRTLPVIICNTEKIQIYIKGTSFAILESVNIATRGKNYVTIICKIKDTGSTEYVLCDFRMEDDESKVLLSAEL